MNETKLLLLFRAIMAKIIKFCNEYPTLDNESDLSIYYKECNLKAPIFFIVLVFCLIFTQSARFIIYMLDGTTTETLVNCMKIWAVHDIAAGLLSFYCYCQGENALRDPGLSHQKKIYTRIQVCCLLPTFAAMVLPLIVPESTIGELISYMWFVAFISELLVCTWLVNGIPHKCFLMIMFNTTFCLLAKYKGFFVIPIYGRLILPSLISVIFFIAFDRFTKENFLLRRMLDRQKAMYEKFLENIQDPLIMVNPGGVLFCNEAASRKMGITPESFYERVQFLVKNSGNNLKECIEFKLAEPPKEMVEVTQEKYLYYDQDSDLIIPDKLVEVTSIASAAGYTHDNIISLVLHDSTEEYQRADLKYRNMILFSLSHELRNPLNIFQAFLDISKDILTTPEQKQMRSCAKGAWRYLKSKISDIMDYAQILSGEFVLHKRLIKAEELVKYLKRTTGYLLGTKIESVRLQFDIQPGTRKEFVGDRERLEQILLNFLSNAIKYTSSGTISLSVSHPQNNSGLLIFAVADTGCGMSKEKIAKLFEINSEEYNPEGCKEKSSELCGLGLTVSRLICSKMNSEIVVNSVLGKGSTFSFSLLTGSRARISHEYSVPDEEIKISLNKTQTLLATQRSKGKKDTNLNTKILIVDDNDLNRFVAKSMVSKLGFPTEEAQDGILALKKVQSLQNESDLDRLIIFMDVNMPIMDGIQATLEIRKLEKSPEPIIIALTAFTAEAERVRCIDAGMNGFIGKPLTKDILREKLEEFGLL